MSFIGIPFCFCRHSELVSESFYAEPEVDSG